MSVTKVLNPKPWNSIMKVAFSRLLVVIQIGNSESAKARTIALVREARRLYGPSINNLI